MTLNTLFFPQVKKYAYSIWLKNIHSHDLCLIFNLIFISVNLLVDINIYIYRQKKMFNSLHKREVNK